MKTPHTPTPWRIVETNLGLAIVGADIEDLAALPQGKWGPGSAEQKKANADFIVRACNAHDDLLAALETLLADAEAHAYARFGVDPGATDEPEANKIARAAIAKATAA